VQQWSVAGFMGLSSTCCQLLLWWLCDGVKLEMMNLLKVQIKGGITLPACKSCHCCRCLPKC
jgi:hypothetical protein